MTGSVLVDTNVYVYAYDSRAGEKQQTAIEVLAHLVRDGREAVSTQVLGEFLTCLLSPAKISVPPARAIETIRKLSRRATVHEVTAAVVEEALRGVERHGMSCWDAQIWAVARLNGIQILLTEDGPSGTTVEGVGFVDPFAAGSQLEALLESD